jgi:hypothetical protein
MKLPPDGGVVVMAPMQTCYALAALFNVEIIGRLIPDS